MASSRLIPLEADAQATILSVAELRGWRWYHTHDARRSPKGFPDLVLVAGRVVYAELKREGEKTRPEQVEWLDALARAGAEAYVWTIADFDEVAAVLGSWTYEPVHQRLLANGESWTPRTLWIPERGVVG